MCKSQNILTIDRKSLQVKSLKPLSFWFFRLSFCNKDEVRWVRRQTRRIIFWDNSCLEITTELINNFASQRVPQFLWQWFCRNILGFLLGFRAGHPHSYVKRLNLQWRSHFYFANDSWVSFRIIWRVKWLKKQLKIWRRWNESWELDFIQIEILWGLSSFSRKIINVKRRIFEWNIFWINIFLLNLFELCQGKWNN